MPLTAQIEMDGSPYGEKFTPEGFAGFRKLLVPWAERYEQADVMAYALYPYCLSTSARCVEIGIEPFPAKQTTIAETEVSYELAVLTCRYSNNRETPQTDDLVTESLEPSAEFITLDYNDFRWGSVGGTALKEQEAPGRLLRCLDWIVTFHKLFEIPAAALTVDVVNASPIYAYTLGCTFPAETLLYAGITPSRKITTEQVEAWTATYRFTYRPNGWNKFWRQQTQAWERMYHKDTGVYNNFPLVNFSSILP